MDCFKDFLGSAYEEHTKCITEEERYSAKGFVAKEKKGEKKQNTWVDLVQSVLDEQKDAPRNVLRIIENISKHQNTPRKKPKFVNFVKNVCGHKTNQADIDQAWDLISVKLSALSNANNRNQNQAKPTNEEEETSENAEENGDDTKEEKENGHVETEENPEAVDLEEEQVDETKLSKKQLKQKKKQEKYEAELLKAEAPLEEEEAVETKKGKKKNRTKSTNENDEQDTKKNKRKRQDTVNSNNGTADANENGIEPVNGVGKPQKKKGKIEDEEVAEESMCLHDQNVAKISELAMNEKFNWHAVILSLLEKKGNELPFKRLQKKVLGEYAETTGREVDDRIAEKFIKKLKSLPNVRVDKNRVLVID